MPVLGVVVTLAPEIGTCPGGLASFTDAIARTPGVAMVGEPDHGRLPLVLETEDREGDESVWAALVSLPGVLAVDLAFADFSDLSEPPSPLQGLSS